MRGRVRWLALGAGVAAGVAILVTATTFALQRPREDWGAEAGLAARRHIADFAAPGAAVELADVKVRPRDIENERSVCGSFAVWDEHGTLGPYRDFWVVVTKRAETWAEIETVETMAIGHDAFLDRSSPFFANCLADAE